MASSMLACCYKRSKRTNRNQQNKLRRREGQWAKNLLCKLHYPLRPVSERLDFIRGSGESGFVLIALLTTASGYVDMRSDVSV